MSGSYQATHPNAERLTLRVTVSGLLLCVIGNRQAAQKKSTPPRRVVCTVLPAEVAGFDLFVDQLEGEADVFRERIETALLLQAFDEHAL